MTALRECANTAAAALAEKLRASRGNIDTDAFADIIEAVLNQATSEQEDGAGRQLVDLEASMLKRLSRTVSDFCSTCRSTTRPRPSARWKSF